MLRLSEAELAAALTGLGPAERVELLSLLEARAALEAEQPEDTRQPIDQYAERARQQAAAKSGDPEHWLAADAVHQTAAEQHRVRLWAERGPVTDDIAAYMEAFCEVHNEAASLATAEGYPPADEVVRHKVPEPAQDQIERALPTLPRATRLDVELSRARREDARIAQLLAKAGVRDE